MKRKLLIVVVVLGFLYLCDFLSVRFRIPARDTFGSVTMHTYYVVKLKSGGPPMTVERLGKRAIMASALGTAMAGAVDDCHCVWFDGEKMVKHTFPAALLVIVREGY